MGANQSSDDAAGKQARSPRSNSSTSSETTSSSPVPPSEKRDSASSPAPSVSESDSNREGDLKAKVEDDGSVDFSPVDGAAIEGEKPTSETGGNDNVLEDVLQMPSPSSSLTPHTNLASVGDSDKPIHLTPGRYIHHFDTYSLVQGLSKGGFTNDQAVTIMKAIRDNLRNNLSVAREGLVSKSDVENELYLFQAACSELQSSLQTARNAETQRQRSSRTQVQHEEDIISQRLNQDLAGLRDDIKGMFNDHKMTTREMQRSIDTSIQELNYKITVSLNSDGKSAIEGLRWILTRRAAMAIATSACKFLSFLFIDGQFLPGEDISRYKKHEPATRTFFEGVSNC